MQVCVELLAKAFLACFAYEPTLIHLENTQYFSWKQLPLKTPAKAEISENSITCIRGEKSLSIVIFPPQISDRLLFFFICLTYFWQPHLAVFKHYTHFYKYSGMCKQSLILLPCWSSGESGSSHSAAALLPPRGVAGVLTVRIDLHEQITFK